MIPLTLQGEKGIINHNFINCVEEEEYLRKPFREPSVGERWQGKAEKGTLEQTFTKEG